MMKITTTIAEDKVIMETPCGKVAMTIFQARELMSDLVYTLKCLEDILSSKKQKDKPMTYQEVEELIDRKLDGRITRS